MPCIVLINIHLNNIYFFIYYKVIHTFLLLEKYYSIVVIIKINMLKLYYDKHCLVKCNFIYFI